MARFSSTGRRLATCAADRTVRLWDPAAGRLLATMTDGGNPIDVWFNADDSLLLSHGFSRTPNLWEVSGV